MPNLPPVLGKLNQFLHLHWKIILIVVTFELVIIIGTAYFTYVLSSHAACETDKFTSSAIQTSTVSTFKETTTTSDISATTRPVTTSSTQAPPNNLTCSVGFLLINGKCWQLLTWGDYRSNVDYDCWGKGGSTLLTIRNQQENDALVNFVSDIYYENFWLGLVCKGNTTSSCIWDKFSGTAEGYDNFAPGHPNVTIGECVTINTRGSRVGQWESCSCNVYMYFVCELPPTINDNNCYNNYNNHCYLRYDKDKAYSIADAQKFCKTKCANVVSINSANENRYVQSIYYIKDGYITLGAAVLDRDDIYWLDGSTSTYNNIRNYNNGTCAEMLLSWDTGYWTTTECSSNGWFLCKRPAGIECLN
ncbi:C-type lectin domain-containing protein [Caenorhabditis elegans]|uniref:C-type lectin domain-containing protein n=1 Tax=Caenorhabditis elegans TaxID=6239 RepID=Q4ZGE4_CAEEL|nr:C-type lectin domain-containing protein [Caenorhabditis elegans]CAI94505.2 C-type lectin domain-containing protein [Caenorhabditis elegans]|eukprot:NP_001024150.2 C-type LECtin [Caenorhabditis elegans]